MFKFADVLGRAMCVGIIIGFSAVSSAQTVTPGQVQDTLRKTPELKSPAAAPVEQKRNTHLGAGADGPKVTVTQFTFSGNTVYSNDALADLVKDYVNRPITLSDIYDAADVVSNFYLKNGYGLASVNVPAQKISGGTVKLEVIEGRLSRITVEGNKRHKTKNILGYLGEVKQGEVYRGGNLQESMRKINELPGLKAKAIVAPGDQYGTSDIVIKTDETLLNGSLTFDNYGRTQIDEYRTTGQIQINNPFTIEDQINLLALHSVGSHLRYYFGSYSLPINYFGTRVQAEYGHADFIVKGTPVSGHSDNSRLSLIQPIIRSAVNTLTFTTGVTYNTGTTNFDPIGKLSGSSITLFDVGGSYIHLYDSQAVTQVSTNISSTFGSFDTTTPPPGTTTHDDQALKLEVDALHLQPLPASFNLLAHVNAVYSPDQLADSQKFNVGGPQNVRGYPALEIRRDRGYFGSLTLSRPFQSGPLVISPRTFVDSGKVYNVDPLPGGIDSESLSSIGIGSDFAYEGASFKIDWSVPITSHVASDNHNTGRVFGALSYTFN